MEVSTYSNGLCHFFYEDLRICDIAFINVPQVIFFVVCLKKMFEIRLALLSELTHFLALQSNTCLFECWIKKKHCIICVQFGNLQTLSKKEVVRSSDYIKKRNLNTESNIQQMVLLIYL